MVRPRHFIPAITSLITTALLCSTSFAENRRVTVPLSEYSLSRSRRSLFFRSSALYLFLNSRHFSGSWENHFRSSSLGEISLIHSSKPAFSFLSPLGHSRSTYTRLPSPFDGGSYIRLIFTILSPLLLIRRSASLRRQHKNGGRREMPAP